MKLMTQFFIRYTDDLFIYYTLQTPAHTPQTIDLTQPFPPPTPPPPPSTDPSYPYIPASTSSYAFTTICRLILIIGVGILFPAVNGATNAHPLGASYFFSPPHRSAITPSVRSASSSSDVGAQIGIPTSRRRVS